METQIFRIIDANFNRCREGLRVVEEFFRFVKNDKEASMLCKEMRHLMSHWLSHQSFFSFEELFEQRNIRSDIFKDEATVSEAKRKSSHEVVFASVQRVKESLRVLEEYVKILSQEASLFFQKVRFDWYDFEQKYCGNSDFLNSMLREQR